MSMTGHTPDLSGPTAWDLLEAVVAKREVVRILKKPDPAM